VTYSWSSHVRAFVGDAASLTTVIITGFMEVTSIRLLGNLDQPRQALLAVTASEFTSFP
jgi:hypothetical protein